MVVSRVQIKSSGNSCWLDVALFHPREVEEVEPEEEVDLVKGGDHQLKAEKWVLLTMLQKSGWYLVKYKKPVNYRVFGDTGNLVSATLFPMPNILDSILETSRKQEWEA